MAAAAGKLLHQALSLLDDRRVSQGEAGIAAGNQQLVGDVLAGRGGVAAVASGARALVGVVERMASQAGGARLRRRAGRSGAQAKEHG